MLVPVNVNIPGASSPSHRKLPPSLVKFGSDELILIEMQGSLEVDGNKDSQLVGKLRVDPETVRHPLSSFDIRLLIPWELSDRTNERC